MFKLSGECGLERSCEVMALLAEPLAVAFRPGGFAIAIDQAMVEKHPGDAMLRGFALRLIGVTQPKQSAQRLLVFGGDVDGGEMGRCDRV